MERNCLLIGLLIIAVSGMAFADHTPVPDLESCPPTADQYGTPIAWNFVPLPLFNIFTLGGPVNFASIDSDKERQILRVENPLLS